MIAVVASLFVALVHLAGPSEVPIVCRAAVDRVVREPDEATRLALRETMCAARERMASLTHLANSDVSKLALEIAAAPTFAVLEDVSRKASARWRFAALSLRGDLYVEMSARLRSKADKGEENESADRVADWLASARRAYADARIIAFANPELLVEWRRPLGL